MRQYIFHCTLTICLVLIAASASSQSFMRYYGAGINVDKFIDGAVLNNGNYVCVGFTSGVNTIATVFSPTGQLLFERRDTNTVSANTGYNLGVTATFDGGFTVIGSYYNSSKMLVVRYSAHGDTLWHHSFDAIGQNYGLSMGHDIVQTPDSGFAITGLALASQASTNISDAYILKLNAQGDSIWAVQFGSNIREEGLSIINTSDGGLLVTAKYEDPALGYVPLLIKLSANGVVEWSKSYNIPILLAGAATFNTIENPAGEFVVAAAITDATFNAPRGIIFAVNAFGDSLNTAVFDTGTYFNNIVLASGGGYLVSGFSSPTLPFKVKAITLHKLDNQFTKEWQQSFATSVLGTIAYSVGLQGVPTGGYMYAGSWDRKALLIKTDELGNVPHSFVQGKVISDANANCTADIGEFGLSNNLVQINAANNYFGYTNANGEYSIEVYDTGQALVTWHSPNSYWALPACQPNGFTIALPQDDTLALDLFLEALIDCAELTVTLDNFGLRRCFQNQYTVNYCNNGTVPADSAYVSITFDEYLHVDTASIPWELPQSGYTYTFNVGNLSIGQCGSFEVWVTVDCDSTVLGQAHCVEAHIYPDSICLTPSPDWDKSSLKINSQCGNDTIQFELKNKGTGDMNGPMFYIIVEDNVMYKQGQFQLLAGQSLFERIPANGKTYTMITPQSEGHPGKSNPLKSVEGCGRNNQGQFNLGFLTQFPQDDQDVFVDILCLQNSDSYDPNDKRAEPQGIGTDGYVNATQPLDYTIRFQNTGTDTAFLVVLRDTLPQYLDITTLQLTGASHDYTFQIINSNILEWTFMNILLPDSNVNEPLSHGYVSFSIEQTDSNAVGTEIKNRAGIYFDFNAVVLTNYTLNTIVENYLDKITVSISEVENNGNSLQLYPNPNNGQFFIQLKQPIDGDVTFAVYDLAGKQVLNTTYNGNGPHAVAIEGLETGMYLYKLTDKIGIISTGKVLINR